MFKIATFAAMLLVGVAVLAQADPPSLSTVSPAAAPLPAPRPHPAPTEIEAIVNLVKPSLVRIHVVEEDLERGASAKSEAYGSGVIISTDGYVVTNHHVAGKAKWLTR